MTALLLVFLGAGALALSGWAGGVLDRWWRRRERRRSRDYDDGMMLRPPPSDWRGDD
jgi:hypothetical protein